MKYGTEKYARFAALVKAAPQASKAKLGYLRRKFSDNALDIRRIRCGHSQTPCWVMFRWCPGRQAFPGLQNAPFEYPVCVREFWIQYDVEAQRDIPWNLIDAMTMLPGPKDIDRYLDEEERALEEARLKKSREAFEAIHKDARREEMASRNSTVYANTDSRYQKVYTPKGETREYEYGKLKKINGKDVDRTQVEFDPVFGPVVRPNGDDLGNAPGGNAP